MPSAGGYPSTSARRDAASAGGYASAAPGTTTPPIRPAGSPPAEGGAERAGRRDVPAASRYPSTTAHPDAPSASAPQAPSRPGAGNPLPAERGTDRATARPPAPRHPEPGPQSRRAPAETSAETTFRLRPIPSEPSAPGTPAPARPGTPSAAAPTRPGATPPPGAPGTPARPGSTPPPGALGTPARPGAAPPPGALGTPTRPGAAPPPGAPGAPTHPRTTPPSGTTPPPGAPSGFGAPPAPPQNPAPVPGHNSAPFPPDPSLSWSAPTPPPPGRPVVSFGEPEGYDAETRPRPLGGLRLRPRIAVAAACGVLGLGLIGGALTGSWLVGEPGGGDQGTFAAAGTLWHSIPVDRLFPPTVDGKGAGPGGADRTWTRIAVAPDTGCADALDPLLRKALAPAGCRRLLRATYIDATQSHVTTVGLLFTKADAATMRALDARFARDGLDRRADLVPRPYAPKGTLAAGFGDAQRAAWTVSVLTDAPVVVYAVSGWADDRVVARPEPAEEAMRSGATSAVAQAGLGHEARGLADRVERSLRRNVGPSAEPSS
ncbi:hypothetical protein [Streptomyces nigra]|uniref:hypothetical protein n=1 Tax=Streptomyces nigra TaxID=1827580 RepID=UPI00343262FD